MKRIELEQIHMGGRFNFCAFPPSEHDRERICEVAHMAFREVARIENLLTDFRDSPFNEINKQAGKKRVSVDQEIFDLILKAQQISELTDGAFDISYASVGHLWREAKRQNEKPNQDVMRKAAELIDYKKIELDKMKLSVFLPHKDMRIGLGGIGKGYAVDRACELLRRYGITNFYLNGSGDIRVHSTKDAPRPWRVGIRNPFNPDPDVHMGYMEIKKGALCTSGNYINYIPKEGMKYHHIIDPDTGASSADIVSVSVMAETALEADTIATSAMIMGRKKGLNLLNVRNLYAMMVDNDGKVHLSHRALESMARKQRKDACEQSLSY